MIGVFDGLNWLIIVISQTDLLNIKTTLWCTQSISILLILERRSTVHPYGWYESVHSRPKENYIGNGFVRKDSLLLTGIAAMDVGFKTATAAEEVNEQFERILSSHYRYLIEG